MELLAKETDGIDGPVRYRLEQQASPAMQPERPACPRARHGLETCLAYDRAPPIHPLLFLSTQRLCCWTPALPQAHQDGETVAKPPLSLVGSSRERSASLFHTIHAE